MEVSEYPADTSAEKVKSRKTIFIFITNIVLWVLVN
jgi:hypothetical protein